MISHAEIYKKLDSIDNALAEIRVQLAKEQQFNNIHTYMTYYDHTNKEYRVYDNNELILTIPDIFYDPTSPEYALLRWRKKS